MSIKLKTLLKEETEKLWSIGTIDGEVVGFTKAISRSEALEKFFKHDHITSERDKMNFSASESQTSEIDQYKKYWQRKMDMAKRALENADIK
jgi:hypothetical protein